MRGLFQAPSVSFGSKLITMAAVPAGFQYFIQWEPNGEKLEFKDGSGGGFCDASMELH